MHCPHISVILNFETYDKGVKFVSNNNEEMNTNRSSIEYFFEFESVWEESINWINVRYCTFKDLKTRHKYIKYGQYEMCV